MAELMIRLAHGACPAAVWCARSMQLLAQHAASHFALVVKGVDLRSTGRKSTWVRTPQMTKAQSSVPARVQVATLVSLEHALARRGGGIEPLHVSMPLELKSSPSTSLTHPGL